MKNALSILAALIAMFSTVPYIIDTIKRKTKPNIVTWFTWTLLTAIAMAAAFVAGEPRTGLFLLGTTVCTLAVVLLGLKYGIAKFTLFDGLCQIGAIVGLVLWVVFNSPQIAIIATITIDLIGALPTVVHAYKKPGEETWQTYMLGVLAPLLTIISLSAFTIASLAFPLYILMVDGVLAIVIISRRKQLGISLSR